MKNGWDKFLKMAGLVAPTIWIIYQILYTSILSEALKYFVLTTLVFIYIVVYIKVVLEPRVSELEKRVV